MTIDPELAGFYEQVYRKPSAERLTEQGVKDILNSTRAGHGYHDCNGADQLRRAGSEIFRRQMTMVASKTRDTLAEFTKSSVFVKTVISDY
jgi:hypothetical protein